MSENVAAKGIIANQCDAADVNTPADDGEGKELCMNTVDEGAEPCNVLIHKVLDSVSPSINDIEKVANSQKEADMNQEGQSPHISLY